MRLIRELSGSMRSGSLSWRDSVSCGDIALQNNSALKRTHLPESQGIIRQFFSDLDCALQVIHHRVFIDVNRKGVNGHIAKQTKDFGFLIWFNC